MCEFPRRHEEEKVLGGLLRPRGEATRQGGNGPWRVEELGGRL